MCVVCFTKNLEKGKIVKKKERKVENFKFNNKLKIFFCYCFIAIMILSCGFVNMTASWLSTSDSSAKTDGTSVLPTTGLEFYNKTTKLEGPLSFTTDSNGKATELQIYVKNTGNARAIVRLFYAFYVDTELKEIATTNHFSDVSFGDYWLAHEQLPNTYSSYLFFDGAIEPNSYVKLFNTVTATSDWANKVVTLHLSGESVLYSGNAYTVGDVDNMPWESYPTQWLNMAYEANDFEKLATENYVMNYNGVSHSFVDDSSVGCKVLEITGTGDFDTSTGYNRIDISWRDSSMFYGYKSESYVCSLVYKCSNWVTPANVYGNPLYLQMHGGDYTWDSIHNENYLNVGEYEFLQIETPKLTSNTNFIIHSGVPTKGYTARIYNIYVTRVCGVTSI